MEEVGCKVGLNEAVLVEEGVKWFEDLSEDNKSKLLSDNDRLGLVFHAFMLELGFRVENLKDLPENWKSSAGLTTRYFYPPGEDLDTVLTVTSLGPLLIVHGTHKSSKSTFSFKIRPAEYLQLDGNSGYKNLRRLARLFKNEVGLPLLNCVKVQLGLTITGLLGLPPEISLKIFQNLDFKSTLSMSVVCKQLNLLSKEKIIWKNLFLKDFGQRSFAIKRFSNSLSNPDFEDWFLLYKEEFLNKKERERSRRRVPPPPLFPFPDYEGDPQNPLLPPVPGIVGGDYDRIPFGGNPLVPSFNLLRPRFDPPGPNFPGLDPRRGGGSGSFCPPGFGGGGFGFM